MENETKKYNVPILLTKAVGRFSRGMLVEFTEEIAKQIIDLGYGRLVPDNEKAKIIAEEDLKFLKDKPNKTFDENVHEASARNLIRKWDNQDRIDDIIKSIKEQEARIKSCEDYIMALGESAEERNLKDAWKSEDEEKINQSLKLLMMVALLWKSKNLPLYNSSIECLVRVIEKRIRVYTWKDDFCPEMWIYVDGKYTSNGKSEIQKEIRKILGDDFSTQLETRIIERIMRDTYIEPKDFMNRCLNHHYEFNVKNGIVKIDPKTYEVTLYDHTPDEMFLTKIDVDYDPKATCPIIDKFFEDTLADPSDRLTKYEAIGTSLTPTVITKTADFNYGIGDTGKTTACNLIHKFLGEDNCANLNMKQLTEGTFNQHLLFGKIANIAGDISQDVIKNPEEFKRLTGGDPITGDRKFKTQITFQNQAKFFFNLNELPRVFNADMAFWNRIQSFKYTRVFYDKEDYDKLSDEEKAKSGIKDMNILDKMTTPTELSGLLNKAIEGLIRYYKTGSFSYAKGVAQVKDEWIRLSDSFMAFALDNIEIGDPDQDYIHKKILASRYHKYCLTHKIKTVGDKAMKATLSSQFGVYAEGRNRVTDGSGNQIDIWEGIKWKNKTLDDENKTFGGQI